MSHTNISTSVFLYFDPCAGKCDNTNFRRITKMKFSKDSGHNCTRNKDLIQLEMKALKAHLAATGRLADISCAIANSDSAPLILLPDQMNPGKWAQDMHLVTSTFRNNVNSTNPLRNTVSREKWA